MDFAAAAYAGRLERPGPIPEHPVAVARLVAEEHRSPDVTIAALLHDVLEDTDVTAQDLSQAWSRR